MKNSCKKRDIIFAWACLVYIRNYLWLNALNTSWSCAQERVEYHVAEPYPLVTKVLKQRGCCGLREDFIFCIFSSFFKFSFREQSRNMIFYSRLILIADPSNVFVGVYVQYILLVYCVCNFTLTNIYSLWNMWNIFFFYNQHVHCVIIQLRKCLQQIKFVCFLVALPSIHSMSCYS
jgi:hypothetical protein